MEVIAIFLIPIILLPIVIVYYRQKAKYEEAHPKTCMHCGKKIPRGLTLADGVICHECDSFVFMGNRCSVGEFCGGLKNINYANFKKFLSTVPQREVLAKVFVETRRSPLGNIIIDDNHGLIRVYSHGVVHRIMDIKSIFMDYSKKSNVFRDDCFSEIIEGGFIIISYNDYNMKDIIEKNLPKGNLILFDRHAVKKLFADEIAFLEKLTGLSVRVPIL